MKNEDLVREYILSIRMMRAPSTVANVKTCLERYIGFLNKPLAETSSEDIRRFADSLVERNFRWHSIYQHLCIVHRFHRYLNLHHGCDLPNTSDIRVSSYRRYSEAFRRDPLSREEIRELIQAAESIRDRLIIAMLYHTGLRGSELADLKLHDIDAKKGVVHMVRGKGGRSRWVKYNTEHLGTLVNLWLRKERYSYLNALGLALAFHQRSTNYLFVTRAGMKLSPNAICGIVHEAAERAGIQKVIGKTADGKPIYRVTPRLLRRTFVFHAIADGMKLDHIWWLMGHADPSTHTKHLEEPIEWLFESYDEHFRGVSTKQTCRPRSKVRKAKRGEKA